MLEKLGHLKRLDWLIFLIAFALYLSFSGSSSIYILDEAKNAECAREMFERNDLIVPTFNQVLRTDKPPLHYFFMMLSYSAFGVNPFAARFFSALFGALTILITYLFAKRFSGIKTALLTAIVLMASVHLAIQFHLAVPDPYLVFFMTSAILSFYILLEERKKQFALVLYTALGFGALTKGPVAIALPGLIFLFYLLLSRQLNWKTLLRLQLFPGALLTLLIALPWYILVHLKTNGAWTNGFFLEHNLGRFSSEMEGHGGTFLATLLFVLLGLFPFSVFLPQAVVRAFNSRNNRLLLFSLTASLAVVGFFLLSQTRLPNYTVPALPFLALLTGSYLNEKISETKAIKTGSWLVLVLSLITFPGVLVGLKFVPELSDTAWIGWYFLPVPIIAASALWFAYRNKTELSILGIAATGVLISLLFFGLAYPETDSQNPVAKSSELTRGKEVRYFRKFNAAYAFKLQQEIPEIQFEEMPSFFTQYPDGVVISTRDKIKDIQLPDNTEVSFASKDTFESPTTVLITRKK